ncbi:hypothetical protein [Streptomyces umbrinus]|uniref:hypothetical protein n=1 Tax=Streptomyces umbrinus TaxID=67370 RepID=UPI0033D0FD9B
MQIATGVPVPAGADAVLKVEDAVRAENLVSLHISTQWLQTSTGVRPDSMPMKDGSCMPRSGLVARGTHIRRSSPRRGDGP